MTTARKIDKDRPEASVQRSVVAYAKRKGAQVKRNAMRIGVASGRLDYTFRFDRWRWADIEFKRYGKAASPLQAKEIRDCQKRGILAVVIDNVEDGRAFVDLLEAGKI